MSYEYILLIKVGIDCEFEMEINLISSLKLFAIPEMTIEIFP